MADNQTAGRGRLDRTWEAKAGANLLVSLLFRQPKAEISSCQRVVAVSAVRACREFFSDANLANDVVRLKWPNDLLLNSTKCGGMLSVSDTNGSFIVVGIGINIAWAPDSAAKLADFVTTDLKPMTFLDSLLEHINDVEKISTQELHDEYVSSLATLGKRVRVELTNNQVVIGQAVGVDVHGRLLVVSENTKQTEQTEHTEQTEQTEQTEHTIDTGDVVHLRDANH